MALFSKKSKGGGVGGKSQIELLSSADGRVNIAFGLNWASIVTAAGREMAVSVAKKAKATHFIYVGHQVGYGKLDLRKNPVEVGGRILPATQVAARLYGGDALIAMRVATNEYWLCLIRDGRPTAVDEFFSANGDGDLAQRAKALFDQHASDGVNLTVHTNLDVHSFSKVRPISGEDLLVAASRPDSEELQPVTTKSKLNLPKPVLYGLLVVLALLLANEGWKYKKKQDARRAAALNVPVVDDAPEVAWQRATKLWENKHAKPSLKSFEAIRRSLGTVPVFFHGWKLENVACTSTVGPAKETIVTTAPVVSVATAQGATSPVSQASSPVVPAPAASGGLEKVWACKATYDRAGTGLSNREIVKLAPQGWNVAFAPLSKFSGTWAVTESVEPLVIGDMPLVSTHLIESASKLQEIAKALQDSFAMAFKPVVIEVPKRANGQPYGPDPSGVGLMSNEVKDLKLPLRNADSLSEAGVPFDWTAVVVTLSVQNNRDAASLTQSNLVAQISGAMYAKTK